MRILAKAMNEVLQLKVEEQGLPQQQNVPKGLPQRQHVPKAAGWHPELPEPLWQHVHQPAQCTQRVPLQQRRGTSHVADMGAAAASPGTQDPAPFLLQGRHALPFPQHHAQQQHQQHPQLQQHMQGMCLEEASRQNMPGPQNAGNTFYNLRSRAENQKAMTDDLVQQPWNQSPLQPSFAQGTAISEPDASGMSTCSTEPSSHSRPEHQQDPLSQQESLDMVEYLKELAVPREERDGEGQEGGKSSYTAGSVLHSSGTCKPCLFWYRGLCFKGKACTFCHFAHDADKVHNIRPSKKTRVWLQRRTRQLDLAVKTLITRNELQSDPPGDIA